MKAKKKGQKNKEYMQKEFKKILNKYIRERIV